MPPEVQLMKCILPNPTISMPNFEQKCQMHQATKLPERPLVASKNSLTESYPNSDMEEFPFSIITKVSTFEYQNLKKSILPKGPISSAITVNTSTEDVLGKSPPELHKLTKKNLPESSLNSSELNHLEKQINEVREWPMLGKKDVKKDLNDSKKTVDNRPSNYENGIKQQNINLDEGDENLNGKLIESKNINNQKVIIPSPGYERIPTPYDRSVTSIPVQKNIKEMHRQGNALDQLINGFTEIDNTEELHKRKKEAENKRNQAEQDRMPIPIMSPLRVPLENEASNVSQGSGPGRQRRYSLRFTRWLSSIFETDSSINHDRAVAGDSRELEASNKKRSSIQDNYLIC